MLKNRFFGKKKSTKNLGISSSDPPGAVEGERKNESLGVPVSNRPMQPETTAGSASGGASLTMSNGPRPHHAQTGSVNMGFERSNGPHSPENFHSSFAHPSGPKSVSESRFEVHISPTAFAPIVIPSSTSPESVSASPSKQRGINTHGAKFNLANAERTPRPADAPAHSRSQSSVAPEQTLNSRSRSRRHGIPANFLESVGAASGETKNQWNGQSLGAEHFMNSQTYYNRSASSLPSESVLAHPSASAPVTSYLSGADVGFAATGGLTPIQESVTSPAMLSSNDTSGHSPLPRSNPSYNLAALPPTSSRNHDTIPRRTAEVEHRPVGRVNRGALPQPPVHGSPRRPQREPPQPALPSSPTRRYATTAPQQPETHRSTSPSASSEMEIGYKGLAFPLPPSSEEGLAASFSSSQSSLFSIPPQRRSGDRPTTPKKTREVKFHSEVDRDATPPASTESGIASNMGKIAKDRRNGVNDYRTSPAHIAEITGTRHDNDLEHHEQGSLHPSERDMGSERSTIKNMQDRVAREVEDALGVKPITNDHPGEIYPPPRIRAISEAPRPSGARPQRHPEPTKPLALNPGRKTLQTARGFTAFPERKQIHASASNRELSSSFDSLIGRKEHSKTITAIPIRTPPGTQQDGDSHVQRLRSEVPSQTQSKNNESQIPPSFPLPTPPNSSSALSFLTAEKKATENMPSHRCADEPVALPLTLEDMSDALRTHRVRFEELAGYIVDVAQRHTAEKDVYLGRVGRLEGTIAKMEREIRGLRWLVLENGRGRTGSGLKARGSTDALTSEEQDSEGEKVDGGKVNLVPNQRRLRRSITMPQLAVLAEKPIHAQSKRFGGLGLDFSPDSATSSSFTLSPHTTSSPFTHAMGKDSVEQTPSMDDIIDKLMAVRQWAGSDVRVSVVEGMGEGGNSKRIVFREV
ncbi:hypothetical protein K439DRAFT_1664689 [Ramaria rubella]|nr:hypothetical protein K439DRAFT_1664689 [Ramaria rubella]